MHPTSTYRRHGLFPEPLRSAPLTVCGVSCLSVLPCVSSCVALPCLLALKTHALPLVSDILAFQMTWTWYFRLIDHHQVICRALASHSMRKQATGTQRGAQLFRPANDQPPPHIHTLHLCNLLCLLGIPSASEACVRSAKSNSLPTHFPAHKFSDGCPTTQNSHHVRAPEKPILLQPHKRRYHYFTT